MNVFYDDSVYEEDEDDDAEEEGEEDLPIGAVIGGVIGGLLVIAVIIFLVYRHHKNKQTEVNLEDDIRVIEHHHEKDVFGGLGRFEESKQIVHPE